MSLFDDIRSELGNPHIYQVSGVQFLEMENFARALDGKKAITLENTWGCASDYYPMIWIAPGMTQKRRRNTYIHEMLHLIFPKAPHWWITLAARRLAGGGHGEDGTELCGHTLDEISVKDVLLARCRRASKRYNER